VAPSPSSKANRRTVIRTMKRMLAACYQLLVNFKREAIGEERGKGKYLFSIHCLGWELLGSVLVLR
jgi:hypothetical protein